MMIFNHYPAKGAAFVDPGFNGDPEVGIWLHGARIGDPVSCASTRFLVTKRLFRHATLDGDGLNVAGSFAEDPLKACRIA